MDDTRTAEKRRILEMVAQGAISPGEGADLLAAIGPTGAPPPADQPVDAVKVIGAFRALTIEGDPSVMGAVADGPHRVRQENATLVFEDDPDIEDGFVLFGPNRKSKRRGVSIQVNDRRFMLGDSSGPSHPPALRIRMNPKLPLELDLTAGTAQATGIAGPVKARIAAGTAKLAGLIEPFEVEVDAGSVNVSCRLTHGDSRIRCTAGKIRVGLDPASAVSVTARSTLGKIALPDSGGSENQWAGIGGGTRSVKIGDGEASLDIEATTGAVLVEMLP